MAMNHSPFRKLTVVASLRELLGGQEMVVGEGDAQNSDRRANPPCLGAAPSLC